MTQTVKFERFLKTLTVALAVASIAALTSPTVRKSLILSILIPGALAGFAALCFYLVDVYPFTSQSDD